MPELIFAHDVLSPSKRYKKGERHNLSQADFDLMKVYADIPAMSAAALDYLECLRAIEESQR